MNKNPKKFWMITLSQKLQKLQLHKLMLMKPSSLEAVMAASKADHVASATKKIIKKCLEEAPTIYKAFLQMLEKAIQGYRSKYISEKNIWRRISEIARIWHLANAPRTFL